MKRNIYRLKAAACAVALGLAGMALPLHAEVLNFEGLQAQAVGYTDVVEHQGFTLKGESAFDDALPGDLVGGIMDGNRAGDCRWLACPMNPDGTYYAGLNDGVMLMSRQDHQAFSLKSLDASFIGAMQGGSTPELAGVLRIQGIRADNSYALFDIDLLEDHKQFYFENFSTGDFGNEQFVSMAFFAFACDYSGCSAFETNQGQFAIDNLNVTMAPVPEPATYAMLGAGLLALGAMTRRRTTTEAEAA
jgi:hypothetical protein